MSLGSGEPVSDVSLGGVPDPPLLPGPNDSPDGSVLGGCVSLEPGVLGVEGTPLSIGDGCSEVVDPSDAVDSVDVLAPLGIGEPLGCDGGVSELAPLGVISDGVEDSVGDGVGLVDRVDCVEPGDADGSVTLDGPSVEDAATLELGWSDVVELLVVDSGSLLAFGDGCELAAGLVDVSESVECWLPDCGESELPTVGESDVGLSLDCSVSLSGSELGGVVLEVAALDGTSLDSWDAVLLGSADDASESSDALDSLATLDGSPLDACELPDWASLL